MYIVLVDPQTCHIGSLGLTAKLHKELDFINLARFCAKYWQ